MKKALCIILAGILFAACTGVQPCAEAAFAAPVCAPVGQLVRIESAMFGSTTLLTVTNVTLGSAQKGIAVIAKPPCRILPLAPDAKILSGGSRESKCLIACIHDADSDAYGRPLFLLTVQGGRITRMERFPLG